MNHKIGMTILITLLTVATNIYSQQNIYAPDWVSISNDFISIYVDKKTGRYIVFDNNQTYSKISNRMATPFAEIEAVSPIDLEKINLYPILGNENQVLNTATIMIDGTPVVFGSKGGKWNGQPIIQNNSIVYSWGIGGIDIIQTISIITNEDTLSQDAVQITYDAFNKNQKLSRNIETRMVVDPTANDFQTAPFYLPENKGITTEYYLTSEILPEYWIATDNKGEISSKALKGFSKSSYSLKPSKIYFTTMKKAFKDIWKYSYSPNSSISKENTVVLLYFNNRTIAPNSSSRIAITTLSLPSSLNTYQNNGLEAKISPFINKKSSPLTVSLWLENKSNEIFDEVVLEISVPENLKLYDLNKKSIYNIGNGNIYPVSWTLDPQTKTISDVYNLSIKVQGLKNGVLSSQFLVPLSVTFDSNINANNHNNLIKTFNTTFSNVQQTKPLLKKETNANLTNFILGDTLGNNVNSLSKIYQYLQKNPGFENQQIINLLETEQQLIQEINNLQIDINKINQQYQVLIEVYNNSYGNKNTIDHKQIDIQSLIDNITTIENKLQIQEQIISNINSNMEINQ